MDFFLKKAGNLLCYPPADRQGLSTMLVISPAVNNASSWLAAGSQDAVNHRQTLEPLLPDQAGPRSLSPVPDSAAPSC